MFHKHEWKEIARTYNAPKNLKEYYSTYFFEKLIYGFTTILWECEICQKLRREEMLGQIIKQ